MSCLPSRRHTYPQTRARQDTQAEGQAEAQAQATVPAPQAQEELNTAGLHGADDELRWRHTVHKTGLHRWANRSPGKPFASE
jgi:hypothetical protein